MGKPKAPKPADPVDVGRAQTGSNVSTAIAQQQLNNINQNTPYGSLTYENTGTYQYTDPSTGQTYTLPLTTANVELTPEQQQIFDTNQGTQQNMADAGLMLSGNLGDTYNKPLDTSGLDDWGDFSSINPNTARGPGGHAFRGNKVLGSTDVNKQWVRAINPQKYTKHVDPGDIRQEYDAGGPITRSVQGGGPRARTAGKERIADAGGIQRGFADAGGIQRGIANAGPIERGFADAGPMQKSVDPRGNFARRAEGGIQQIQNRRVGDAGNIQRSYGSDFSSDRQRVEESLLGRLDESFNKDRTRLETRLANQGIRVGSQAYTDAMQELERNRGDARFNALHAGGQEQSRLTGLERDRAVFGNQAQAQQYGQNFNNAQFNSGQDRFNAQIAAQQNQFNAQLNNQAEGQRFGQDLAAGQFQNQAQAQQYGQNLGRAQFANQAQAQKHGQILDRGQFANQAQQQQYGQNLGRAQFANQAQAQQYGQNANDAQFAAQQNQFNAQLNNQVSNDQFRENLGIGQFQNQAQAQQNQQNQQAAQFYNQGQAQQFGQGMANAQLNNQAYNDIFGQRLQTAQANNQFSQQNFANQFLQQGFNNQVGQQHFDNRLNLQDFNNQARQQNFQNQFGLAGAQTQNRNAQLQEAFALRNQPLNEISAFQSGSQVQQPNFVNTNPAQIGNTNWGSIYGNHDAAQQQRYGTRANMWNTMFGGVAGLGGSALGAFG